MTAALRYTLYLTLSTLWLLLCCGAGDDLLDWILY